MKTLKLIAIFIGASFLFSGCLAAANIENTTKKNNQGQYKVKVEGNLEIYKNVEYAKASGISLKLDIYKAKNTPKNAPVLMYVHGGSWTSGSKENGLGYARRYAGKGIVVVCINYRLADAARFPAQIHDVKAAIRYVKANAATIGINPNKFAIMGASAGGHLASLAGVTGNTGELEGNVGTTAGNSKVTAVVNIFGPTDLTNLSKSEDCGICLINYETSKLSALTHLLGCKEVNCPEKAIQASPITYITRDDPPFINLHGKADNIVPVKQSERFNASLKAAGVESSLKIVPGAKHDGAVIKSNWGLVDNFLKKHIF